MRIFKLVLLLIVFNLFCLPTAFAAKQTINKMPAADATFIADLQTFLQSETPERLQLVNSSDIAIVSGCTGATDASLTHTIAECVAFPNAYYVLQPSVSHTYTANKRTFVYLRDDTTRTIAIAGAVVTYDGHFVFAEMLAASDRLTDPTGTLALMQVDTNGTSITAVGDLRQYPSQVWILESVESLRTARGPPAGWNGVVVLKGYYEAGDGGGGPVRIWDAASTATDNGGSVIRPTAIDAADPGRWVWEWGGPVQPEWFGAIGNGIADDTSALTAFFGLIGDYRLELRKDARYLVTGPVANFTTTTTQRVIINANGATIDSSATDGVTNDTLISVSGALVGSAVNINDASKGSLTITATLTGIAPGDILYILSTDLFNSQRSYYYKGEFVQVESVSGSTITLCAPLEDSYIGANTTVQLARMPVVQITDLKINRAGNNRGLVISYAQQISLTGSEVKGARFTGIEINYCVGGVIQNNKTFDSYYAESGNSYGVMVASSQDLLIQGNHLFGGRHALAHGGTTPVRNITITGNILGDFSGTTVRALDVHGNGEHIFITNNTCYNGMNIGAKNFIIDGNRIFTPSSKIDIGVYSYETESSDYIKITNNFIQSTGQGIWLLGATDGIIHKSVIVKDNTITGAIENFAAIYFTNVTGSTGLTLTIEDLQIVGNKVDAAADPASAFNAIRVMNTAGNFINITTLTIADNYLYQAQMVLLLLLNGTCEKAYIRDNYLLFDGNDSNPVSIQDTSIEEVIFTGNTIRNTNVGAGTGYGVSLTASNLVTAKDNTFININRAGIIYIASATLAIVNGNKFIDSHDETLNSLATRTVALVGMGLQDNAVGYGYDAPVAGTWKRGDIIWNAQPVAGSTPGWQCTTGGTPGTWKAMATIAP